MKGTRSRSSYREIKPGQQIRNNQGLFIMITATKNNDQTLEMESGFSVSLTTKGLYGMIKIQMLEEIITENIIKWTKSSKLTGENYIPRHFFEKCYNILNCIVESKDGSVSRNMFDNIDSHYPDYLRFLTELELMECIDKNYSIYKHTSKKYKVSEILLNDEKCKITDKRLLDFKTKMEARKMKEFKKYNNAENVTIGLTKSYVYEALMEHFAHLNPIDRSKEIKTAYANYCRINDGDLFGAIKNDSRLHSNFTRIPKCIRRLVYNNVEELVEFDIHATHIFLLPKAIENMLRGEENKKAANLNLKHLSEKQISDVRKDIIRFTVMLEACFDSNVDVYSEFAKEYGQTITREDIKIQFLSWINNETGFGYDKIDNMMETLYPNIKKYMKDKKYGKYNIFNFELTRLETGLILPICKEIVDNGLTLISVHDCLMFRKKDQEIIFEIITKHMEYKECTLLTWKEKKFTKNSSLECSSTTHLATLDNEIIDLVLLDKDYTHNQLYYGMVSHSCFVCEIDENVCEIDESETRIDRSTSGTSLSVAKVTLDKIREIDESETRIDGSTSGTSLSVAKVTLDKIREIDNNGSRAWKYRGTGKQEMKVSCKKMTKEQFLAKVNEKFIKGEWKRQKNIVTKPSMNLEQ